MWLISHENYAALSKWGGDFVSNRGLKRAILILCCTFNIPDAVYAFLAFTVPTNIAVICGAIVFKWFDYGLHLGMIIIV